MVKVKMKIHTGYDGKKIVPGDVLEISEFLAHRWIGHKIADIMPRKPIKSTPKSKRVRKKRGDN